MRHFPESEIVAKARESYLAAGRLYRREDPAVASRMFFKSWTLSKAHMLPLFCGFLAGGLSLVRLRRSK